VCGGFKAVLTAPSKQTVWAVSRCTDAPPYMPHHTRPPFKQPQHPSPRPHGPIPALCIAALLCPSPSPPPPDTPSLFLQQPLDQPPLTAASMSSSSSLWMRTRRGTLTRLLVELLMMKSPLRTWGESGGGGVGAPERVKEHSVYHVCLAWVGGWVFVGVG
jgi:hypothetical protein